MIRTAQSAHTLDIPSTSEIGIYSQSISPNMLVRSLRAIFNARQDLHPPARGCTMSLHQTEGITHHLADDRSLQSYGIRKGSSIFLLPPPETEFRKKTATNAANAGGPQTTGALPSTQKGTEALTVLFEIANYTYALHDYVEFCTADGQLATGKILGLSENYRVRVQRMQRLDEINADVRRTIEQKYHTQMLHTELMWTPDISDIPTVSICRKVKIWIAGILGNQWLAETGTSNRHQERDHLIRFEIQAGWEREDFGAVRPLPAGEDKTEELNLESAAPEIQVPQRVGAGNVIIAHQDGPQLFLKDYTGNTRVLLASTSLPVHHITASIARYFNIPEEHFYLIHGGSALEKDRSLNSYNIQAESTIVMSLRCRGGADRAAGAKHKKPLTRDDNVRAFEEAAKAMKAERTAAQARPAGEAEPQETMDLAHLQARQERLRLDGGKKERDRMAPQVEQ
jgi:hypothetical protein